MRQMGKKKQVLTLGLIFSVPLATLINEKHGGDLAEGAPLPFNCLHCPCEHLSSSGEGG